MAGSIGPGTKFATLGQISFRDLADAYEVETAGLIDGGVDLLIIETQFDLLGAKAAIEGARRAMRSAGVELPLQVQVTIELTGRMLPGTEIGAALTALEALRPDVIGILIKADGKLKEKYVTMVGKAAAAFGGGRKLFAGVQEN